MQEPGLQRKRYSCRPNLAIIVSDVVCIDGLNRKGEMKAAAVAVDSKDRVYCFNRSPEHPILVFDRDGNFLSSWGAGLFAFPHAIRIEADDSVWITDRDHGQFMKFTTDGQLLGTIGTK